jgi:P27 family predicted phage terminase small subunit
MTDGAKYAAPTTDIPSAPDYLDEIGRATWTDLAPMLCESGRLAPEFLPTSATYCAAVSEHRIATLELQKPGGREVSCGSGLEASPYVGMQREAARIIKDVGSLFLLNPLSLARGPTPPVKSAERDSLDRFLAGEYDSPMAAD